ncbi:hypothetical protein Scep_023453 [Stephania cephalantha]|uniref:Uncharacterized protein n=1 Tax=Stephania cephalantha TaxID=152367 RepID=A0AAP0F072_9MAGN
MKSLTPHSQFGFLSSLFIFFSIIELTSQLSRPSIPLAHDLELSASPLTSFTGFHDLQLPKALGPLSSPRHLLSA